MSSAHRLRLQLKLRLAIGGHVGQTVTTEPEAKEPEWSLLAGQPAVGASAEWAAVVAIIEGVDANGDGFLCSTQFEPNRGQDKHWGAVDYVITQIGDNQPTGRSPG